MSRRASLVECPGCLNTFQEGAGIICHMRVCVVSGLHRDPGRPKAECPHHGWDGYGRPVPPAGYCGPRCWMRPGGGPDFADALAVSST